MSDFKKWWEAHMDMLGQDPDNSRHAMTKLFCKDAWNGALNEVLDEIDDSFTHNYGYNGGLHEAKEIIKNKIE